MSGGHRLVPLRVTDRASLAATRIVTTITVAALTVPVVLIVVMSFSDDSFISFPPHSWGFSQYSTLLSSPDWLASIRLSAVTALVSTVLCVLIGVPAVVVMNRSALPGRDLLEIGGMSSLIIPVTAYAVALYGVFAQFGLLDTLLGVILADTLVGLPMVIIVVQAAIARIPVEIELVAMSMGASRTRAWLGITVRLLLPAISAGALLAFILSFDEAVIINFIGGPDLNTLPKAIFDSVRFGVAPLINAIATLLMLFTALVSVVVLLLRKAR